MRHLIPTTLAAGILSLALLAPAAGAATETLTGKGSDDPAVEFEMDVEAKVKKGTATATTITRVVMRNAKFVCKPTGDPSGRGDYVTFYDGLKIKRNGKFKAVNQNEASGHILNRYTLKGTATGKGRKLTLEGTFHAELSEGGLEFSNCDTGPVAFKLKGKL